MGMNKRFMLIPVVPGKPPVYVNKSMKQASEEMGQWSGYISYHYTNDIPLKIKGEWYYVDMPL